VHVAIDARNAVPLELGLRRDGSDGPQRAFERRFFDRRVGDADQLLPVNGDHEFDRLVFRPLRAGRSGVVACWCQVVAPIARPVGRASGPGAG